MRGDNNAERGTPFTLRGVSPEPPKIGGRSVGREGELRTCLPRGG